MLTPSVRRRDGRVAWTSLVVSAWFSAPRSLKQELGVSVCRPERERDLERENLEIWRERMELSPGCWFPGVPWAVSAGMDSCQVLGQGQEGTGVSGLWLSGPEARRARG